MAAAAIPIISKVAPMVGGWIGSKIMGKKSKDQSQAMGATQGATTALGNTGAGMVNQAGQLGRQGGGYLEGAGNYYQNILSDRSAARESLAPEMTTALDFYRGAGNKAKRTLTGGSRDYATAELDRQKVGQMASFLPQARANAAEALGGLGGTALGGASAIGNTGTNAFQGALYGGQAQFNQAGAIRGQEQEAGKEAGGLIHDIITGIGNKKGTTPTGPYTGPPRRDPNWQMRGPGSVTPNRIGQNSPYSFP